MSLRKLAYFKFITFLSFALLNSNAFGNSTYSGAVSYVQFNDDGSFAFQLTHNGKIVEARSDCEIKNMFLAKKIRKIVSYEKLNRMRDDLRAIYLTRKKDLQVSVLAAYCDDDTGITTISNIMLGKKRK